MDFSNPILLDVPMPIVTPRLILRPPQAGDGIKAFPAKKETFEEIQKWMPWAKELGNEEDMEVVYRTAQADFILRKDIMLVGFEKDSGDFVISTGLHRFDWDVRRFQIGYWVAQSKQGKGYATEAANALTRYAFEALQANAVNIDAAVGNEKSIRVIEKLGFDKEGITRNDLLLPSGELADRVNYSRTSIDDLPELDVSWGNSD